MNTIALPNATVRKLNSIYSKSDFPKTIFKIGSLMKAIKREAAAFIPPESEKKSTESPRKKLKIKNKLIFFLNGNKYTQDMYTSGFIKPNKFKWLNTTTCKSIRPINLKLFVMPKLLICSFLF